MPRPPTIVLRKFKTDHVSEPTFEYPTSSYAGYHGYSTPSTSTAALKDRILHGENDLVLHTSCNSLSQLVSLIEISPKFLYWDIFKRKHLVFFTPGKVPSTSSLYFLKLMLTGVATEKTKSAMAHRLTPFWRTNRNVLLVIAEFYPRFVLEMEQVRPALLSVAWHKAVQSDARLICETPLQPLSKNLYKSLLLDIEGSQSRGCDYLFYQLAVESRQILDVTLLALNQRRFERLTGPLQQIIVTFLGLAYARRFTPPYFKMSPTFCLGQTDWKSAEKLPKKPRAKKAKKVKKAKAVIILN